MSAALQFKNEDNGFCRVYYRLGPLLYCWQLDHGDQFTFFRCSRDGEPDYPVPAFKNSPKIVDMTPLPPGYTEIGTQLANFLLRERGAA